MQTCNITRNAGVRYDAPLITMHARLPKQMRTGLSPFHKQEMQRSITQDQKSSAEDRKADDIVPQRQDVEAETRQNRRAGYFDIKAVLVINERQIPDLVDNKSLETVMEDGELQSHGSALAMEQQRLDKEKQLTDCNHITGLGIVS